MLKIEKQQCSKCNGNGYLWNNPTGLPGYKCPACDTKGYINIMVHTYGDKSTKDITHKIK